MNTKCHIFLLVVVTVITGLSVNGQTTNRTPDAMVTIKVTDDGGAVLTGMPVHVWFDDSANFYGTTDSNGLYVAHGKCSTIDPPIRIESKGYYTTATRCRFTNILENAERQWMPWNPMVTAIVRRVINPIAMYAKCVETKIPRTNESFGYDLMMGDWVSPVGKGVISDLVFSIKGKWGNYRDNDSTLTLAFSQPNDGLITVAHDMLDRRPIGSEFILPRYAPESGYANARTWRNARKRLGGSSRDQIIDEVNLEGRDYLFRVRSQMDETGVVTNACYGKFHGNIQFAGAAGNGQGSWLKFTYYLNPAPNDRNLEFDPKKNLFTNLGEFEQVHAP